MLNLRNKIAALETELSSTAMQLEAELKHFSEYKELLITELTKTARSPLFIGSSFLLSVLAATSFRKSKSTLHAPQNLRTKFASKRATFKNIASIVKILKSAMVL